MKCLALVLWVLGAAASAQTVPDVRALVLIPEQIIRLPVPDPAAETEIQRALIAAGFRVMDVVQTERLKAREEAAAILRGSTTKFAVTDLALRFKADVLVTGEAFAEELAPTPEMRTAGLVAYRARLELKAIDLSNGQLFFSKAYTTTAAGVGDFTTGKAALEKAATLANRDLILTLSRWGRGPAAGIAARVFILKIANLPSYSAMTQLLALLRQVGGVSEAKSRQFDSLNSEIEIAYSGSVDDLAGAIEGLGIEITNVNAGEIRAKAR